MRKRIIEIDLDDESWQPGDVIRHVRRLARLNREEVADAAGTAQSHMSQIETGASGVGFNVFIRIMRACGFSVKIILERSE